MKLLELLEMLRAQKIRHGDCPVVLGVEVDGQMTVGHIEAIGTATNEYDEIAVCLATKPMEVDEDVPVLRDKPDINGMLTDL